jgi:hypothetical protein
LFACGKRQYKRERPTSGTTSTGSSENAAEVSYLQFTHVYATTVGSRAGTFEAELHGATAPPSERLTGAD